MRTSWGLGAVISVIATVTMMPIANASPVPPLSTLNAPQILATSLKAATSQKSATSIVNTSIFGITAQVSTQSGLSSGISRVTVNGHSGEIIDSRGVIYANLDAAIVNFEFHSSAPAVANKWIAVSPRSRYFSNLSLGLTLPSILRELTPTGPLTKSMTVLNGRSVMSLTGRDNAAVGLPGGTQTLYVSTSAPFLPVGGHVHAATSGITFDLKIQLKDWGRPLRVNVPKTFTSIAATALK